MAASVAEQILARVKAVLLNADTGSSLKRLACVGYLYIEQEPA